MTPKFHSLKINDVRTETEDTVSISFTIPSDLRNDYTFESGQYLTLKADLNNEDVRRSYSLCSSPYENEWRVAVKQVPNGKFSTYAANTLEKGMMLDVMTPTGNFKLSTSASQANSYVLFAAGSGITPMLSIAKSALHDEPNSDVTLFYGNKGFASIIFREEIEALKNQYMGRFRIIHILSRESLGNVIQKGRIDKEKTTQLFDAFLKNVDVSGAYICGPESMIIGVKEALIEKGVDSSKIHFELFTAPSTESKPIESNVSLDKVESNVSVIIDGEQIDLNLDSSGENVLDAAQKAGGDLPYACKGGVCCTCKARILEGSVHMDVNYALEQEEVDAGYILTCQSHPTSKKLVISFDD